MNTSHTARERLPSNRAFFKEERRSMRLKNMTWNQAIRLRPPPGRPRMNLTAWRRKPPPLESRKDDRQTPPIVGYDLFIRVTECLNHFLKRTLCLERLIAVNIILIE